MSRVVRVTLVGSVVAIIALAHPHNHLDARAEVFPHSLPDTWYHPADHPVHRLFQRSNPNPPGSPGKSFALTSDPHLRSLSPL